MLARHPDLDAPLPIGFAHRDAHSDVAAGISDALSVARDALHAADPDAIATSERRRRRPRLRHEGHVASIVGLDELAPTSRVALRSGPPPALTCEPDERLRLDLGDRMLHLPPVARAALEQLLRGSPLRVSELADLDAGSQLVLARRLVREGMLVLVGPAG